jgi:hypothetical protein
MAMLGGKDVEKYSPGDLIWTPVGLSDPLEVADGDIVLVRAVGLQEQPQQDVLQVQADIAKRVRSSKRQIS